MRTVLERLAIETGDPQETVPDPSTVQFQATEVRVERMELTSEQQSALDRGVVGTSWRGKSQEDPETAEATHPHGSERETPKKGSRPDVTDGVVDAREGPFGKHPGISHAPGKNGESYW